jgi:exopolyphosphatase/guanosine-5'-triphosphate,3'-diphosphate pyrophosphatase
LKKQNLFAPETRPRNWRDAALEFARSCHSDLTHSKQVAYLSREIFNSLSETFNFYEKDGQLLETAAILHDIGYFIAYSGHHKHSYHLIRHADLFGFSPREREIIAHIARYHRKSLPKKKHESFARLVPQDQLLVRRLGGILRLADGLDRRRNSIVSAIGCSISKTSFEVRLMGSQDLSVELYGGRGKGDLFEKAFSRKLSVLQG